MEGKIGNPTALKAYLKLVGQKQGEIRGSETSKGREGQIAVIAASHEIVSPRDAQSGLPTGPRVHKPFVITKDLDASSPLLYRALVNNENLTTWELRFTAIPFAERALADRGMENPLLGWPPARDIKSLNGSKKYIALFESLDEALPIKRLIVGPGRRQSEDYELLVQ